MDRRSTQNAETAALADDVARHARDLRDAADLDPLLDRIGDARVVMLGEAPGGGAADAPDINVHVYVPDAVATFDRARAAGGTVVQEPGRGPDGDMRGGISDGNGTTWWISTHG